MSLKSFFNNLVFALTSILFLTTAAYAEWVETITLPFGLDNKEWDLGWQNKTDTTRIVEFIPKGQAVENWKELVTLQFYPGLQSYAPGDYLSAFLGHLQSTDSQVTSKIISTSADDALAEWHILNSNKNPNQFEVDRVVKGTEGLHMIHYAIKTSNWSDDERTKWLNFLCSAKLKKTS